MTTMQDVTGPGMGLFIKQETVNVWNRSGSTLVVGHVVMFDRLGTEGKVATPGAVDHWAANVIKSTAIGNGGLSGVANARGGFFGVVTDLLGGGGLDDTKMQVCVRGYCNVLLKTGLTIAYGDELICTTAADLDLTNAYAAERKVLAWYQHPTITTTTAINYPVYFNGIEGLGWAAAS